MDVLDGEWKHPGAQARLKAAAYAREECCGPLPTRLEHSGPEGTPIAINIDLGAGGTK